SYRALAEARSAFLRPPSNIGNVSAVPVRGPSRKDRVDQSNRFPSDDDSKPAVAFMLSRGKNADFANPICAFAAAMALSAAAISGRRSSSADGNPTGTWVAMGSIGESGKSKSAGDLPKNTARL